MAAAAFFLKKKLDMNMINLNIQLDKNKTDDF
jgi:hypothetical protein